jgi:hypothetical protein
MSYPAAGKIKVVQFWRMRAVGGRVREPTSDIKAAKWLRLELAIITRVQEKVFLAHIGPIALKAAEQALYRRLARNQNERAHRRSSRSAARAFAVPNGKVRLSGGF